MAREWQAANSLWLLEEVVIMAFDGDGGSGVCDSLGVEDRVPNIWAETAYCG